MKLKSPISELNLSPRTVNLLYAQEIKVVGHLVSLTAEDLLMDHHFSTKRITEIEQALAEHGLSLADDEQVKKPVSIKTKYFLEGNGGSGESLLLHITHPPQVGSFFFAQVKYHEDNDAAVISGTVIRVDMYYNRTGENDDQVQYSIHMNEDEKFDVQTDEDIEGKPTVMDFLKPLKEHKHPDYSEDAIGFKSQFEI